MNKVSVQYKFNKFNLRFCYQRAKKKCLELSRTLSQRRLKYSEDYMDLNYIFIKSVAATITHYLSKLINACFQEGIFPDSLKIASVIPLHKEGEKSEPNNFHPTSFLPTLGKILEKNCSTSHFQLF